MKNKTKIKLEKEWGKPKSKEVSFDLIGEYAYHKQSTHEFTLSDVTLVDLDFDSYFRFVDRTSSAVGQQYLYYRFLCQSENAKHIEAQEELVQVYKSNKDKRLESQSILSKLSKANDYYFPYLIFTELPKAMYPNWIINILQISMLISLFLSFKHPAFILISTLLFAINLGLHYYHKNRIGNFTTYFSRLKNLATTLRTIFPSTNLSDDQKSTLLSDVKHIDKISSHILFLKTDNLQNSEFGGFFWFAFELLKIFTLSEITVFNKLVNKIRTSKTQIDNVFTAIGKIDVAISICNLREGLAYYSIPTFTNNKKEIKVKELYHPLIVDCVTNDIELSNKSLLLTGSNMAGKSTFIKALNLNALNAQVLNTSFAEEYTAPVWHIATSMTIKDNLNEKSSYYMEEVSSIGKLIEYSKEKNRIYLFTIDEIFKGTNTIERISTAKAILEFLDSGHHMVLVSTHDIELTKLLHDSFDLYFFQEGIIDKTLSFDYKVKKGTLEKSNAITILEIAGYPKSITEEARKLALKITNEKTGLEKP